MAGTHDIERLIFRNLDEIEDAWRAGNDAGGSDRVIAVGDVHGAWCVDVTSSVRS